MTNDKTLIIGAGISGATLASLIAEIKEKNVTIVDKNDSIAGNCYDYIEKNIMIHKYGSHIFHTPDKVVWNYLRKFTDFNTYMHKVIAIIDGIETTIPFNFNTIHDVFPRSLADRLEKKLLDRFKYNSKIPIKDFVDQDDIDLKNLADYIYEKVFLHYTEKQWGKKPSEIDGAVTARVPVYLSKDDRYFQDVYQGIPLNGYTKMIEKMLAHPNIDVRLNTDYKNMDLSDYSEIFCTGSIDEFFDYKYGQLPYRSVRFELETYDREHYQSNAVVNYPCNYDFTRIHEYKYYLNDISDKTIIAKEYSEPFELGKNDRYYPIPDENNQKLYDRYLDDAKKLKNVHFLGRLGDYKYYDMDKAVRRAMDVFKEVYG